MYGNPVNPYVWSISFFRFAVSVGIIFLIICPVTLPLVFAWVAGILHNDGINWIIIWILFCQNFEMLDFRKGLMQPALTFHCIPLTVPVIPKQLKLSVFSITYLGWIGHLPVIQIHSFSLMAFAGYDDCLLFKGAFTIPLCYTLFPVTLLQQLFFYPSLLTLPLIGLLLGLVYSRFTYNTLLVILVSSSFFTCLNYVFCVTILPLLSPA
jgi:hypothetical protein